MTESVPFRRRFNVGTKPAIHDDFPARSRIALFHVLRELREQGRIVEWEVIGREIQRLKREYPDGKPNSGTVSKHIEELDWPLVFEFCELVFEKLLQPEGYWDHDQFHERLALSSVRAQYVNEINRILLEDSISFAFVDGRFVRPGGKHYQAATADAQLVLVRPELARARRHFAKAMRYRDAVPHADPENAVKEAAVALEEAVDSLFPELSRGDFTSKLKQLRGRADTEIPPALFKVPEGLYAFRGAGEGVAHGGARGGVATPEVAEYFLSVVASSIVYLVALAERRSAEPPF